MDKYWEIGEGKVDSAGFFKALPKYFPEATTFYAEGTSISGDVKECYGSYQEEGKYLPSVQTIFPIPSKFRCKFSHGFMEELASLAQRHAEPEILDHMALYKDREVLLMWHDAFANVILISRAVPKTVVSKFAAELGQGYC